MKINQNLVQRQQAGQHHAVRVQRLGVVHGASFFRNQRHHVPDVFVRTDHEGLDHRLLDFLDIGRLGQIGWVINLLDRPISQSDLIDDAGIGRDNVHAVLAPQPLLDDFQMQQPQEAAPEAKPQRHGCFRLVHERRIIQLKFGKVGFQVLVIGGVNRINAAEDHGMDFLEPGQRRRRVAGIRDRVAHFDLLRAFDIGGEVTGLALLEFLAHVRFGIKAADFLDLDVFSRVEEFDCQSGVKLAVENPHMRDHALVGVEIRVEPQRLQRRCAGGLRGRDPVNDGFENFIDADAFFGAGE